jgi:tRNA threonylcarbamoyladenosine biosynthesis protein TsaB
MTYILHIETATKVCSVALSLDGELKQLLEINEDSYAHGEKLTLLIEECLKKENIKANLLKAISVSSGPGSYTGLRIGVSVAKGLCYALEIPLISIDSLECLYEISKKCYPNHTIIPMIDARRMEVFSKVYASNGSILKDISADILDEKSYSEFEPFIVCGNCSDKLVDLWNHRNIIFDLNSTASAKGQVSISYAKYIENKFEDLAYFEPFYLKDFVSNSK